MNEPSLLGRQRPLLRDLEQVAAERARVEPALADSFRAESARADEEYAAERARLDQRKARRLAELEEENRQCREAIETRHAEEVTAAQAAFATGRRELAERLDAEKEAADAARQEAQWAAEALLEGAKTDAEAQRRREETNAAARVEEMQSVDRDALELLEKHDLLPSRSASGGSGKTPRSRSGQASLDECVQDARARLAQLRELPVLRLLSRKLQAGAVILLGLLLVFPLGWLIVTLMNVKPAPAFMAGAGGFAAAAFSLFVGWLLDPLVRSVARKQTTRVYLALSQTLADAEAARDDLLSRGRAARADALDVARKRHLEEAAAAKARHQQALGDIARGHSAGTAALDQRLQAERGAADEARAAGLREAEQSHAAALDLVEKSAAERRRRLDAEHHSRRDEFVSRHRREWHGHVGRWKELLNRSIKEADEIAAESDRLFPAWDDPRWPTWQPDPAAQAPPVVRLGSYDVRAETVVEAEPWTQARPAAGPIGRTLPALCPCAEPASLLFHARDEGRARAVEAMQATMFRLLTTLPPGRVRFTIVDPVSLGRNFAAFMNLADHDESLVGGRIWTEPAHVEQRLADLTAHVENVIQKYLRNRYPTIGAYNAEAGEVAEPYRVLVVADFPVNFTAEAVRRLVSLSQSGPRCGLSLLLSRDDKQPLPRGFELADLEAGAINLDWHEGRFRWRDDDFGRYTLALDAPPAEELGNRLLRAVGEAARAAHRVEVPFEFIAPPPEMWWQADSRAIVSVPLGRAGATRRQHLELGKGTSQHALVAGKTGSGKSTLLHALIVNLALTYSPDEVELYLVDFKKGVEFKTYATHELPHARVVAIESEREFGLSVLQRLDAEISARGERFRAAGVQDVRAFRTASPDERMPRVLLIVDEFQEFFVEDDRLAQEAARLLDRLVRQGRAFGVHVLLGSQTLGGAYSLARSTIDQMAVRVALQCSEADAHLILSDDNSAARLLSRPGEAIYNDANGRVEGNDPFQVVWLGDEQRERYLARLRQLAGQSALKGRPAAVVFEGNADADPARNDPLNRLLALLPPSPLGGRGVGGEGKAEEAWLGEAMAIDELTAATFRRQHGSNLLVVGQHGDTAAGMLATAIIALAAHGGPRCFVADGHQAGPPAAGPLAALPGILGERLRLAGSRGLPEILTELSDEVQRRSASPAEEAPSLYLVLHGLQRMRDLRRQEDDFGLTPSQPEGEPPTPDRQLATLLREGPPLGIHVLMWCDTLNNLQRVLDRQALREVAMRVVFQMGVADSSGLIDSPAAAKLGPHRALFCDEEDGRLEKFRPYGAPPAAWLARARAAFAERAEASVAASPPPP